jgi:two-component system chemotaxis sensor kinase CheA
VVDALIGQQEIVIKPLSGMLKGLKGLAGVTILGDGRVALILDVRGLSRTNNYKKEVISSGEGDQIN